MSTVQDQTYLAQMNIYLVVIRTANIIEQFFASAKIKECNAYSNSLVSY